MPFRDELGAAHARIKDLESDLARASRRIAELEHPQRQPEATREKKKNATIGRETRRWPGGLTYQPPWSYFPLWVRLGIGFRYALGFKFSLPPTDNVLHWLVLRGVVLPLYYLAALPFVFLCMLPYFAAIALATTPVVVLIKALSGLRFDRGQSLDRMPPPDLSETEVAMTIFVTVMTTLPICFPIICGALTR